MCVQDESYYHLIKSLNENINSLSFGESPKCKYLWYHSLFSEFTVEIWDFSIQNIVLQHVLLGAFFGIKLHFNSNFSIFSFTPYPRSSLLLATSEALFAQVSSFAFSPKYSRALHKTPF